MNEVKLKYSDLGIEDKNNFQMAVLKCRELGLSVPMLFHRMNGKTPFSARELSVLNGWFELGTDSKWRLKQSQEVFDLIGLPYPV